MTSTVNDSRCPARRMGRPRDPNVDRVILQSALKLLTEHGYAGFSVEQVAKDAAVGKTAIYRRYASKEELAAAAVGALKAEIGPPPDTGDTRKDLVDMIVESRKTLEKGPGFQMIGALLVEEHRNPDLIRIFRERILWPRRDEVIAVLRRGVDRGEISEDADLEIAVQAVVGSIIAGHVVGVPTSRELALRTVDTIWDGLGRESTKFATEHWEG